MLGLPEDWLNPLDIRGKRKMLLQDMPNVIVNLVELKREKHCFGFKVAHLQNEYDAVFQCSITVGDVALLLRKRKVIRSIIRVEPRKPIKFINLMVFQNFYTTFMLLDHGMILLSSVVLFDRMQPKHGGRFCLWG